MPVYGLMIAFHAFVLLHLADGPLWKKIAVQESEYCRQNWWSNLLFINNYVDADHPVREKNFSFFFFFYVKKKVCELFTIFSVLLSRGIWLVTCNFSSLV